MARPATRGPFGEHPGRETVRFVGGPRDGDAGRYYGLLAYPDIVTPGGSCRLGRADHEQREVSYLFHHAGQG